MMVGAICSAASCEFVWASSIILVEIFQLFNYSVCASIKRGMVEYNEGSIIGMGYLSLVNTEVNWLLVLRVCVGCHERCPSTYLRSLFCPTLSLVLDNCVRVLCSTASCCLLSILAHSCHHPSTYIRSLFCPTLSLVLLNCRYVHFNWRYLQFSE